MKTLTFIIAAALLVPLLFSSAAAVDFNSFFIDKTIRVDYHHTGSSSTEIISLDKIYEYGQWAGSTKNLLDNFNNGRYYIKVYDAASGTLIYSKGFDSYFGEYKISGEGINGINKSYHETALIPSPKSKVRFAVERRNKLNKLEEIYTVDIDPVSVDIIREEFNDSAVKVVQSLNNGSAHEKVDVAILAEGYTAGEEDKFRADLQRFTDIFFKLEPYKSLKDRFNVYGVFKPSLESGTDEPRAGIFKKTALNSTFNSLGSERYLLTEDNKAMRDMAASVPYDAIYIMVNHSRYGGGGIYNLFCTFTADNQWHEYLFLHEFGHSFAGLADEYYTSDVAYNEFYPEGVEPVEPNITALLTPSGLKWEADEGIEVPTPWEKEEYDAADYKWQAERRELNDKVSQLKKNKAPKAEIDKAVEEYDAKDREHSDHNDKFLKKSKYVGMTGAFEGAGYAAKGLYRPMLDCIMFSKGTKPFCSACSNRIKEVIDYYSL